MRCRRLIYTSRVARQVRYADAEQIAAAATTRNGRSGITGLLLYTPSHFIQVIEGEPESIDELVARIRQDARHSDVRVIDDRTVADREFGAWAMRAQSCLASTHELERLNVDAALRLLRSARDESS